MSIDHRGVQGMRVGTTRVESTPSAVVVVDPAGRMTGWNPGAQVLFGSDDVMMIGRPFTTIVTDPDVHRRLLDAASGRVHTHAPGVDVYARHSDGTVFPVEIMITPFTQDDQRGAVALIRGRKAMGPDDEALRRYRATLDAVVELQHELVLATLDVDRVMRVVVERTQALTGADGAVVEIADGDEMVYRAACGSAAPHLGTRLKIATSLSGLSLRTGEILESRDCDNDPRVDGPACRRIGVGSMVLVPLKVGGDVIGVLKVLGATPNKFVEDDTRALQLMGSFIATSMANSHQYQSDVLRDSLTGLANRALLRTRVELAASRLPRNGMHAAIFYIDVDHFKAVNDSHGHAAGDAVLIEVARRLLQACRPSDTVARLGGDEFVVLCDDLTEVAEIDRVTERFRRALTDRRYVTGDIECPIGVSIGASELLGSTDVDDAVDRADRQMYRAKAAGRGLVRGRYREADQEAAIE